MTDERIALAKDRIKERNDVSWWRKVITAINASSFLLGENKLSWRADPDWLLKPGNAGKVLEGKYGQPAEEETVKTLRCECCGDDGSTAVAWGCRLCYPCLSAARPFAKSADAIMQWLREQQNHEAVA